VSLYRTPSPKLVSLSSMLESSMPGTTAPIPAKTAPTFLVI